MTFGNVEAFNHLTAAGTSLNFAGLCIRCAQGAESSSASMRAWIALAAVTPSAMAVTTQG